MIQLSPPDFDFSESFDTCIDRATGADAALVARLRPQKRDLATAESEYLAAKNAGLHRTLTSRPSSPALKSDMTDLYSGPFRKKDDSGESLWDRVISVARNGMCPFCMYVPANTVDHHLGQAAHPRLAVTPANLVPACRDCNFDKGRSHGDGALSPYWDSWATSVRWLKATIDDAQSAPSIRFEVDPALDLPPQRVATLQNYLSLSKLPSRYKRLAIDDFTDWREDGDELRRREGPDALRQLLEVTRARELRFRPNGWKAAAYSEWIRLADTLDLSV